MLHTCPGQSNGTASPAWHVAARCMLNIHFETDDNKPQYLLLPAVSSHTSLSSAGTGCAVKGDTSMKPTELPLGPEQWLGVRSSYTSLFPAVCASWHRSDTTERPPHLTVALATVEVTGPAVVMKGMPAYWACPLPSVASAGASSSNIFFFGLSCGCARAQ